MSEPIVDIEQRHEGEESQVGQKHFSRDRGGILRLGGFGAIVASLCCLTPVVLVLIGLGLAALTGRSSDFSGTSALADPPAKGSFDLSQCLIPRTEIRAGGPPKDGIPALTRPGVIPAEQATYLAGSDRVIGVHINGQDRAYPLRILVWHENVNDELGGVPLAVTYCPLCDSAVAFDRQVGGKVREFGISGLLYNSNVLLYDRQRAGTGESLWSQLQMKAVCGPAAQQGLKLKVLPAELTSWSEWMKRHPNTTVLSQKTGHRRDYGRSPYGRYFSSDRLMFPVKPAIKKSSGLRNKDKLVVVRTGGAMRAYPIERIAHAAGSAGVVEDTLGRTRLRLTYLKEADSVRVETIEPPEAPYEVVYTFWFAWYAMHPDGDVYRG